MPSGDFLLRQHPDWQSAAGALVNGLASLPSAEDRLDLLEHICESLGADLYPAFLSILYHIQQAADANTSQLLATALVDCLVSGRLPSGAAPAWGSSRASSASEFHAPRQLGPIEYLCAWKIQGSQREQLTPQTFVDTLTSVIELTNADPRARSLYISKLSQEATDPMTGAFSKHTRSGLGALVDAWQKNLSPHVVANHFLDSAKPAGLLDQAIGKI